LNGSYPEPLVANDCSKGHFKIARLKRFRINTFPWIEDWFLVDMLA
jgi:hypothetical protein